MLNSIKVILRFGDIINNYNCIKSDKSQKIIDLMTIEVAEVLTRGQFKVSVQGKLVGLDFIFNLEEEFMVVTIACKINGGSFLIAI
jgi:hypothetical protein